MQINEVNYNITTYQWDYQFPVVFEPVENSGFSIGDKLLIEVGEPLNKKEEYTIQSTDFQYLFKLTKEEADKVFSEPIKNQISIPYTIKHLFMTERNGQQVEVLDTLFNANLIFMSTLKWEDDNG